VSIVLPPLTEAGFTPHPLHATERTWTETNCYVDVWIEVLHALGLDPVAAAAFTLNCDFEGDQWTFFKYPPEDLRTLFGLEVSEMNIWRPVVDHVEEQLAMGRLCTVEGDAWFLPDTRGVSYRSEHVKTTIVPARLDRPARHLGYFHNAGFYELGGDDFDGLFRLGEHADPAALPPYVESIRLDGTIPTSSAGVSPWPVTTWPDARPTTRSSAWRPGCSTTCRGWPPRTSRGSTSTPSDCAVSAGPAPSWRPPSSTG